jgi:rod shape-determining protein MreD
MTTLRIGLAALLLVVAVTLQLSLVPNLAVAGVSCDLVLIIVAGLGLSRGPEFGAVAGFVGGLLLDVVPPADHAAGRWALALTLAGYVAGRARRQTSAGPVGVAVTIVLCVALSLGVFSAAGAILHDPSVDWSAFGMRLGIAAGYDVVVAILVVPLVMWMLRRVEPARERFRVMP